jgi:hypothetical protein
MSTFSRTNNKYNFLGDLQNEDVWLLGDSEQAGLPIRGQLSLILE